VDPAQSKLTREEIRLGLEKLDIESRPIWKPLHQQPVFSGSEYYGYGVSDKLFEQGLCLPSGSGMSNADRDRVINAVLKTLEK